MSYFRFYIYKAIRKVLFFYFFPLKGLIKVLFLVLYETSIIKHCLPAARHENSFN